MTTRIRLPAANRCATASSFEPDGRRLPLSGSRRTKPSLTFVERPSGSTSDTRTNRSACGLSVECATTTTGQPRTSSGASTGDP